MAHSGIMFAADKAFEMGSAHKRDGVEICFLPEDDHFRIAIKDFSRSGADFASIDVFYLQGPQTYCRANSPAPVWGPTMSVSDLPFQVPLEKVRLVRVRLLVTVGWRNFNS